MVKLIAIDLDGTLLNSQGRISKGNLATIRHENQGVKIVLYTDRPYLSMKNFVSNWFVHPEDYITFNGVKFKSCYGRSHYFGYPSPGRYAPMGSGNEAFRAAHEHC